MSGSFMPPALTYFSSWYFSNSSGRDAGLGRPSTSSPRASKLSTTPRSMEITVSGFLGTSVVPWTCSTVTVSFDELSSEEESSAASVEQPVRASRPPAVSSAMARGLMRFITFLKCRGRCEILRPRKPVAMPGGVDGAVVP